MLGWKDNQMGYTNFWNIERPLYEQVVCTEPQNWQCENRILFAERTSWILLLLRIIFR